MAFFHFDDGIRKSVVSHEYIGVLNHGFDQLHEFLSFQRFQGARQYLTQQGIPHTRIQRPFAIDFFQPTLVKELGAEIVLYVGGCDYNDAFGNAHLFQIRAHFFTDTDGAASLATPQTVIQQKTVVGGLKREKIANKHLMGRQFKFGLAQPIRLFFHRHGIGYGTIVLCVVKFGFLCDFDIE